MALLDKQSDPIPEYLMSPQIGQSLATTFMKDLLAKIKVMRELDMRAQELEHKAEKARQDFEHYKATVVVAAMQSAGVTTLRDENGLTISLDSKYTLQPNKGDEDRKIIVDWLKKHGGDHLIKHQGVVPEGELKKLQEAHIPFDDKTDVNTQSLKSFVLDLLGLKKGSTAKIEMSDIPDCMHFYVVNDIVVEV